MLQIKTKIKSLKNTPTAKAYPPRWPLLRLCLRIENITGPTEIPNKIPNTKPLRTDSNIMVGFSVKEAKYRNINLSIA